MNQAASDLVKCCKRLYDRGLVTSSGGNVSIRLDDGVLISPGGRSLGEAAEAELCRVNLSGRRLTGPRPSKETAMHLEIYARRPDCAAVIHTHSPHCLACSCVLPADMSGSVPPITAYFAARLDKVPNVPFMVPGSTELAQAVGLALQDHQATLLQNHGVVTCAASLDEAMSLLEEVETAAQVYLLTHGAARTIPAEDVERMRSAFTKSAPSDASGGVS